MSKGIEITTMIHIIQVVFNSNDESQLAPLLKNVYENTVKYLIKIANDNSNEENRDSYPWPPTCITDVIHYLSNILLSLSINNDNDDDNEVVDENDLRGIISNSLLSIISDFVNETTNNRQTQIIILELICDNSIKLPNFNSNLKLKFQNKLKELQSSNIISGHWDSKVFFLYLQLIVTLPLRK